MKKEEIINKLNKFLEKNPNPHLHTWINGNLVDSDTFKGFLSESWLVGGMTGGSCWAEADTKVESEDPKELTLMNDFLELEMPELSFIKYRKLLHFVKLAEWGRSEYYGNYDEYKCYYITFDDIADFLAD